MSESDGTATIVAGPGANTSRPCAETALRFLERRGIDRETAIRFGVYTVRLHGRGDERAAVPTDHGDDIHIAFPMFRNGIEVATKFRGPNKRFEQRRGGEKTFINADALDRSALETGDEALVIVEGEIDLLTALQCGATAVSVPDGAPPVPDGEDPEDLSEIRDPKEDAAGKWAFLWNDRERLRKVKRFILATDADKPGRRLRAELVRRLGPARCWFVDYPEDCKDLNDVLVRYGEQAVRKTLQAAQPYPVHGLYRLSDYPRPEPLRTVSLGWPALDDYVRFYRGGFFVVTGTPGSGKSKFINRAVFNMARDHGWRAAIFSPEMPVKPFLEEDLLRMYCGCAPNVRPEVLAAAERFIEDRFCFIDADPAGLYDIDEVPTIDWLLEKAEDAVLRYAIDVLVIDPWNELEHARRRDESMTDYIGRAIRPLKSFARRFDVAVIVIAHPTKDVRDRKRPTLYDIADSAAWNNKADIGLILKRVDDSNGLPPGASYDGQVWLFVDKVRFATVGKRGVLGAEFFLDRLDYRVMPVHEMEVPEDEWPTGQRREAA